MQGLDALLSIVQMPKGVPVGTLAIGRPGAANAALLAAEILANDDPALRQRLKTWREGRMREVLAEELATVSAILPGATIGILGGGQLGRMTAMAARSLGYRMQVMDPDPSCPARFVVDACFEGSWDDAKAAADLARGCDVVTLEIEQLSLDTLRAAQRYAPVRPGEALLAIIQDRIVQKEWLAARQFPVGPFRSVRSLDNMRAALDAFGRDCFVKSARGGYDGRSQLRITPRGGENAELAWRSLGQRPCIAEQAIALDREISVLVARTPSGALKSFPSATNHHENQILAWSVIPSSIPPAMERRRNVSPVRLPKSWD